MLLPKPHRFLRRSRSDADSAHRALPGATKVSTETVDGVPLHGVRVAGPAGRTFVVVHGMTHSITTDGTAMVIRELSAIGSVLAFDLRGHGTSGGGSTVGDLETLDVDAAVAHARESAKEPVAVVGFSLGGAVALRQAAFGAHRPDAVVSVSAPSRWYVRDSAPMRRVNWLIEHPVGALVGPLVGIRLGAPWTAVPPSPLVAVSEIEVPLLVVHGTADHYFPLAHGIDLQRASVGRAELWVEQGMGHAENATSRELASRIGGWVVQVLPG